MSRREASDARQQRVQECDVSTCKLEVFDNLPFPSTSWYFLIISLCDFACFLWIFWDFAQYLLWNSIPFAIPPVSLNFCVPISPREGPFLHTLYFRHTV